MKINEIFYSLQGEGSYTGTPAVFVRFSGCNIKCDFCDTRHQEGKVYTEDEAVAAIKCYPSKHVIFTGGEPTLQLTTSLVEKLKSLDYYVQIETNGSVRIDNYLLSLIDWVTCSPKYKAVCIGRIDELKVVYQGQDMDAYDRLLDKYTAAELYLQPCDRHDEKLNEQNLRETIAYIKENPIWKLSLQTQKILNVR